MQQLNLLHNAVVALPLFWAWWRLTLQAGGFHRPAGICCAGAALGRDLCTALLFVCLSGNAFPCCRVGDVYPSQMCSVTVKMFIYRYSSALSASSSSAADGLAASHLQQTYSHQELPLTRHLFGSIHNPAVTAAATAAVVAGASPQQQQQQHHSGGGSGSTLATDAGHAPTQQFGDAGGGVNVLLRYPVVVGHEIGPTSPLQEWVTPDGMLKVLRASWPACYATALGVPHFSAAACLSH